MSTLRCKEVERTLEKPDVHNQWKVSYRTAENEKFFEQAIDYILSIENVQKDSKILDIGCGSGTKSVLLARRGFSVLSVDFSESVLEMAESNIQTNDLQDKIKLQRENILSLTFDDKTFDYILCWGVLMHIPELEKAISELVRVLKIGGVLIISEGNVFSLQSIILRNLKRFLGKEINDVIKTPSGIEYWASTPAGRLLTREANISWLIKRFNNSGFTVKKHISTQFTELYTRVSSRSLKKFIHIFNNIWFKYIRIPFPAFGNMLILQKEK